MIEKRVYENRFDDADNVEMNTLWKTLVSEFFQQYVLPGDVVLDAGAGKCWFINNVRAKERIALDVNNDISKYAKPDVKIVLGDVSESWPVKDDSLDVVFMSNILEHLKSKDAVMEAVRQCYLKLARKGRILILHPDIKNVGFDYYDFIDHRVSLTRKSIIEALESNGFVVEKAIAKFLPYTSKSRFPKTPLLVSLYLKMPLLWKLLGKHCFIVGVKE